MNSLNADLAKLVETIVAAAGGSAAENLRETMDAICQRLTAIERRLAILENLERAGHDFDPLARSAEKICQHCDRKAVARGLCSAHYQQWRYHQKRTKLRAIASPRMGLSLVNNVPDSAARSILDCDAEGGEFDA